MKLKKIIAREFLFLLSTTVILGLIFISLKIYNSSMEIKIDLFRDEVKLVENNYQTFLLQPLKPKDSSLNQNTLNRIIDFYNANSDVESHNIIYQKFPELKGDSVVLNATFDYYATINSKKYNSLKELNLKFNEFFIINQSHIDSLNNYKTQIELLQNDISKYYDSTYTHIEILKLLRVISIWLLIVIFGLRYIYYLTKWAIRILQTE